MRATAGLSLFLLACAPAKSSSPAPTVFDDLPTLTLDFKRIDQEGYDPFTVTAYVGLSGETLDIDVPHGDVSTVIDNADGTYSFTVTPETSGVYPVTVSWGGQTVKREALVVKDLAPGVGQPLAVPGDFVNTSGYEDGITITPDGNYLFIQYGPIYFSGLFHLQSICQDAAYSLYNLKDCGPKPDSAWIFDTIGPYADAQRPGFPTGSIEAGKLSHADLVIPGTVNGLAVFPTVFYGFKRQSDGSFAEPFKVAFNDARGTNGPFGLSFRMTSATTADFVVAWNNYYTDLGDDKPDIYAGSLTMGEDKNLGDVVYQGDFFASITPHIQPVNFSSHTGVQGNPSLYGDTIWTDDEQTTHDISVQTLTAGNFPDGTWVRGNLPAIINTTGSESQPHFTGTRLYLTRESRLVYHAYLGGDYGLDTSWSAPITLLEVGSDTAIGSLIALGEPTIATYEGKTLLYFAYVTVRAQSALSGRLDLDINAGFVEIP